MSDIILPDMQSTSYIKIRSAHVYDFDEAVAASKYPMQVYPDPLNSTLTPTATKLAQSPAGEGHDNWLTGVLVSYDICFTAKALVEAERYNFYRIVSCNSTMHRIVRFDLDTAYIRYTNKEMIEIMKRLVAEYNENPTPEKYLEILYSNPAGFIYTMRITTNYRQLKTIYKQRRTHRLPEWREFCNWIETLPHHELITGEEDPVYTPTMA